MNNLDKPAIAIFGSSQIKRTSRDYKKARELAFRLAKRGYVVLNGGGSGIMEAVNAGVKEARGHSIAFTVRDFKAREKTADYNLTSAEVTFVWTFVRRFILGLKSEALIFFPGGYGTLNEIFEYAMLAQTEISDHVPIICIGKKYWTGLRTWLQQGPLKEGFFHHGKKDLELLYIESDIKKVLKMIERSNMS